MADWKKLTLYDGREIWLNLALATSMIHDAAGIQPGTRIMFDKDHGFLVKQSVDVIRQ